MTTSTAVTVANNLPAQIVALSDETVAQVAELTAEAMCIVVTDAGSLVKGNALYDRIKILKERISKQRLETTRPIDKFKEQIIEAERSATKPLADVQATLGNVLHHVGERLKAERAEAERKARVEAERQAAELRQQQEEAHRQQVAKWKREQEEAKAKADEEAKMFGGEAAPVAAPCSRQPLHRHLSSRFHADWCGAENRPLTTSRLENPMTMSAYHGDTARKTQLVDSMKEHRRLDCLVQGSTGSNNRGCAVSCAFQSVTGKWQDSYDHGKLAAHLDVPMWVPRIVDRIFEGLDPKEAGPFAQAWLEALPVGADLSNIWPQIGVWLIGHASKSALRAAKVVTENWSAIEARRKQRLEAAVAKRDAARDAVLAALTHAASGAPVSAASLRSLSDDLWKARREAEAAAVAVAVAEASAAVAVAEAAAASVAAAAEAAAVAAGRPIDWGAVSVARQTARRDFWGEYAAELLRVISLVPVVTPV